MDISSLDGEQRRHLLNTQQLYREYRLRQDAVRSAAGSMSFVSISGHEYLVKSTQGRGARKRISLGRRSAETELVREQFYLAKKNADERLAAAEAALGKQARINVGYGLGRIPRTPSALLRRLDRIGVLGAGLIVQGSNSLYAYETLFGCHFSNDSLSTMDIDFSLDSRTRLRLMDEGQEITLVDLFQSVDRTFQRDPVHAYAMVNSAGYMVELIKPSEQPPWRKARHTLAADDLQPSDIVELRWLVDAPKLDAVSVGEDGYPVPMRVIHPAAFAAYKAYLHTVPSRDSLKRGRDAKQAQLIIRAALESGFMSSFTKEDIGFMPDEAARAAEKTGLFALSAEMRPDRMSDLGF